MPTRTQPVLKRYSVSLKAAGSLHWQDDSWLREIKFKVPDVRFMGENISNAEIIRRADVIWIQTNCIGHAAYYGVINLARRYNRKVRYFSMCMP